MKYNTYKIKMSDSSSEEDLSRFKDVVDTSFTQEYIEKKAEILESKQPILINLYQVILLLL